MILTLVIRLIVGPNNGSYKSTSDGGFTYWSSKLLYICMYVLRNFGLVFRKLMDSTITYINIIYTYTYMKV